MHFMGRINIDQVNIGLMLLACGLAYVLPFELVLFSYAFLGPAHYLTQISWLHDREYYVGSKWLWVPFTALVALMVAFASGTYEVEAAYIALCVTFGVSMALVLAKQRHYRVITAIFILVVFVLLYYLSLDFVLALTILLPTFFHIYIFTGCFILLGALKSNSFWGIVSFFIFIFCGIASFVIIPQPNIISQTFVSQGLPFFKTIIDYLIKITEFNGYSNNLSVLGFLSFAYTYHYLNWFSKTEILKWHQIPKRRAWIIVALYMLSIGLYLYDYKTGFMALLLLSLMHVVLEFPLDVIAIKSIPGLLRKKLTFKRA
jgi:hypothetical protein